MTTIRKKVAKPSMTSMSWNAGPGFEYAKMAAHIAAARPAMDRPAKKFRRCSPSSGSRTMINTPTMVRLISGRMRRYSTPAGMKLPDIRHLRRAGNERRPGQFYAWQRTAFHLFVYAYVREVQNLCVLGRDGRHEALRERAHPNHQHDQRHNRHPFTLSQVVQVRDNGFGSFPQKHTLIEPQHVARRENYADGAEHTPFEMIRCRALQHQILADKIVQHRQANTRQHCDHKYARKLRRRRGDT